MVSPLLASERLGTRDAPFKLSAKQLTGLLEFSPKTVYYGGYMVPEGEAIDGPVVVISKSFDLQDGAVVTGDVWVINGRLILTGNAKIDGDVKMINSMDFLAHEAVITGSIEYFKCECKFDDKSFEEEGKVGFVKYDDPNTVRTKLALGGNNTSRVDYSLLTVGVKRENNNVKTPYVRGRAWVSVSLIKKNTGYLGFDGEYLIPLAGKKLGLNLHGFSRTFTNDDWMMSGLENTGIIILTGDDYFDYWERQGGEVGLVLRPLEKISLEVDVSFQKDRSLEAHAISSILYPRRKYRLNPAIDEGNRLALTGKIGYDGRGEDAWRESSWFTQLWIEKGIADGPGDFSYAAFDIDLRRYNYLPWQMRLDLRAKVFSAFSSIPPQLSRSLNGYSGIRGTEDFPFGSQRGDRLALFSFEFRRRLPDLPVFKWFYSYWDLLLFSDIGYVCKAKNDKAPFGFLDTPLNEWKKTAGIGFSGDSFLPGVGFYMAQDLDRDHFDPRFILRVQRSF